MKAPGKRLTLLKFLYFFMQAGLSCFLPYATLYSYHLGLTPSQVGLIWGLEPLVSFLCAPLWGSVADKYSKHKQIFMACLICGGGLFLSLLFIPPANLSTTDSSYDTEVGNCTGVPNFDLECPVPKTTLDSTSFSLSATDDDFCVTMCSNNEVKMRNHSSIVCDYNSNPIDCDICVDNFEDGNGLQNYSETASNDSVLLPPLFRLMCDTQSSIATNDTCDKLKCCNCHSADKDSGDLVLTFGLCMFLVLLATIFQSVLMAFVDALCFAILAIKGGDYGKQRLWGSIGWGIFAFMSGIAVDRYNEKLKSDRIHYDPIFYMYISFMALTFFCTVFMRFPPHKSAERLGKNLWLVLRKAYVIAYFGVVVIMGIGFGITGAYLFLFMTELKSSYLVMGLSQFITTMAEIPCFFVSGPIIKRIGHNSVFCLGLLAFCVRLLGFSFAPNPWVILPFQVLHGITFGLFWAAVASYATMIAPDGMIATLQTICTALHFGVGRAVGISLGGIIFEKLGSRNLFRICAGLFLTSLVVYYLLLCCLGIKLTGQPTDDKNPSPEGKQEKTEKDDQEADVPLKEIKG
ncbi:major facilitator superfamily domain-containing protein 6-like isoform X2 [Amphiura filiformis]|uniref:major facilitator superfamily domain-containing protein 6-like isoform X2 n=1 Tax=Amphiura filiformis TaxID=82378 RepID=UPI003B2104B0